MHFVYIIRSINSPDKIYVGRAEDVAKRLVSHNSGGSFHTDKFRPWKLVLYMGFENKKKASEFEEYLKSGTGRAFRDKRLL
jgi:putative endonuclease